MNTATPHRDRITRALALGGLLILGALALAGPYGLLSWQERSAVLEEREARIAELSQKRQEMQNRVRLLETDQVDPDFASELVRQNLNVAHPDEYVIDLEQQP